MAHDSSVHRDRVRRFDPDVRSRVGYVAQADFRRWSSTASSWSIERDARGGTGGRRATGGSGWLAGIAASTAKDVADLVRANSHTQWCTGCVRETLRDAVSFSHASRNRLTPRDLARFPSESLFDRIARAVCRTECLPRKELYEAWEVARRARRRYRGGRVIDLACGHGLVAHLMLVLDDSSLVAHAVDTRIPASAQILGAELARTWPRIAGRVMFEERPLAEVALTPDDIVVSVHACGALTDDVLDAAIQARARVVVLPCCQVAVPSPLDGWLDSPLAIDVGRAQRLVEAGYDVVTQTIAAEITPKNRLLLGAPRT